MLFANSTAILTDAFPADQRGLALGINQVAAHRRVVPRPGPRRPALGVGLARGVLGQRPGRCRRHRLGVPARCTSSASGDRASSTCPGNLTFALGLSGFLAAHHVRDPAVRRPRDGLDEPVGAGRPRRRRRRCSWRSASSRPGSRTRCSTSRCSGSGRSAAGNLAGLLAVDRPRRPAVHADHLAAGHLAAAARLQLREHAAVGRHLPAAADRRLPRRGAGLRAGSPTGSAPGRSPSAGCCWSPRPSSGCCCCRSTSPTRLFAAPDRAERRRLRAVLGTQRDRRS